MKPTTNSCGGEDAANGAQALDRLCAHVPKHFDLVLMDLQMPVMDGYETARRIRAMRDPKLSAIPIVTMTANALARDLAPESACGVSRHLSKPIDLTALHAALCEVLHENRQQIAIETIKNTLWNHPQRIFRF